MSNIYKPRQSINIDQLERVDTTSPNGLITKPTWEAIDGAARAREIAEARMEAEAEHQRYLLEQELATHPHTAQIKVLAQQLAKMESKVEYLLKMLDNKIVEQIDDRKE